MSKKNRLRGKVCVYCAERPVETEDHIFSRRVFQTTPKENVRKVPACERCNNYKSRLEEYAGIVLLFGSEHPEAVEHLDKIGSRRLAKNRKLAHRLGKSMKRTYRLDAETGYFHEAMTVDVESDKIAELMAMIARALYYWERTEALPPGYMVEARWVRKGAGEDAMRDLIGVRGYPVQISLASGLCDGKGLIGDETPGLSAWVFSLFGGVLLGVPGSTHGDSRVVGVLTGPASAFEEANSRRGAKQKLEDAAVDNPARTIKAVATHTKQDG
ncbi:MAG: hypothetical protein V4527_14985 [Pseudomonadota bacterium]